MICMGHVRCESMHGSIVHRKMIRKSDGGEEALCSSPSFGWRERKSVDASFAGDGECSAENRLSFGVSFFYAAFKLF